MGLGVSASDHMTRSIGIVGQGRAGRAFAQALEQLGWDVHVVVRSQLSAAVLARLADSVDIVLLCVPDGAIADVVSAFDPESLDDDVVLVHCSGASGLEVLSPAVRRASLHPLVSLTDDLGSAQRLTGAYFAVAGDPAASAIASALAGHVIHVNDSDRAIYHAGAAIASNHLVALLAQVESIADRLSLPLEAFLDLARGSLENTSRLGPAVALTGPVSRGDLSTVEGHIRAFGNHGLEEELDAYLALARRAAVLAGRDPSEIDQLVDGATPE